MTQDEAIKKAGDACNLNLGFARCFVEMLVALGMLKLDEPKSLSLRIDECLSRRFGPADAGEIGCVLDRANLKIVDK